MSQHRKGSSPPEENESKNKRITGHQHARYTSPSSHSDASQYSSTSQEKSNTELPQNPAPEENRGCLQLADVQQAPYPIDGENMFSYPMRTISSSYMLQRFLTIDVENEPLRHEVNAGILEGRVYEGEDMMHRKMYEECWEEVDTAYESIVRDLEISSAQSGSLRSTLRCSTTETYPEHSETSSN